MFLRFERLMEALRIAPSGHHAAGEFVDDHDLVVADDVILVAMEQRMGLQRLLHVMNDRDIGGIVERALLQEPDAGQQLLDMLVARLGEIDGALLLVEFVIGRDELGKQRVDRVVEIGFVVGGAGDDQRRARFVDEDRVDFVDDGEHMAALNHLRQFVFHIVAQIVEAELVVGAVGDVGGIGWPALFVVEIVDDDADAEAEKLVDAAHPVGVAAGEIIVDGDDMDAVAGERIEIGRKGGDEGLAFAGPHLGDGAFVQHHAADELHIEMALAERALGGLADGRESRHENFDRACLPAASSARNASVRARSSSSESLAISGSSALMAATFGP